MKALYTVCALVLTVSCGTLEKNGSSSSMAQDSTPLDGTTVMVCKQKQAATLTVRVIPSKGKLTLTMGDSWFEVYSRVKRYGNYGIETRDGNFFANSINLKGHLIDIITEKVGSKYHARRVVLDNTVFSCNGGSTLVDINAIRRFYK